MSISRSLAMAILAVLFVIGSAIPARAGLLVKKQPAVKASPASARLAARTTIALKKSGPVQGPVMGPVQAPAVQAPAVYCKTPCITYKHHGTLRKTCCGCAGTFTAILQVEDPCTCCVYDIPVCVPDCCVGEPRVHGRLNALGRGAIVYHWCCGYKVKLVFHRCGDVTVHMIGR
jgi:hypothetical protein